MRSKNGSFGSGPLGSLKKIFGWGIFFVEKKKMGPSWVEQISPLLTWKFNNVWPNYLAGAQPPPGCSFAHHLVGKMVIQNAHECSSRSAAAQLYPVIIFHLHLDFPEIAGVPFPETKKLPFGGNRSSEVAII